MPKKKSPLPEPFLSDRPEITQEKGKCQMDEMPGFNFRLSAADGGRPDAVEVAAALRQLKGRLVHLTLSLQPLNIAVEFGGVEADRQYICGVMQQMYPGAKLEAIEADTDGSASPCVARVNLELARPLPYPLKTWASFRPQDPVAALGGAVRELEAGERLESRLSLSPAPVPWQPPVPSEYYLTPFGRLITAPAFLGLALMGSAAFLSASLAVLFSNLSLGLLALGLAVIPTLGTWLGYQGLRWRWEQSSPELEAVKRQDTLFEVALTLRAQAASPERARALLTYWLSDYQVFDAGANRWTVQPAPGLRRFLAGWRPIYLTAGEIAGHWHLPVDPLRSPFSARQGHRPLMPPPLLLDPLRMPSVAFPVGHYSDGAQARAVYAPRDLLAHHTLVLGKTQSGKSRLVERLCEGTLSDPARSLVVIDPHSSLVRRLAGKVPVDRQAGALVWDLGRCEQPVPLNLLAAPGAAAGSNVVADDVVEMLRALWTDSWGPRLEYHLGYILRSLLAARVPDWPAGPGVHPFSLLNVQNMITDEGFRLALVNTLADEDLKRYWRAEFEPLALQRHVFLDVFMPVLNKVGAYVQREPARHIVGQFACSPILDVALTRPGAVLVDLAPTVVGADTARLVASTLLLCLRNQVAQRQHQPPETWTPLTVVVDELQWLNPGSLDRWMAELTKFGVNLIVVTQSLELLDAADPRLRPQVLANVGNLFAFDLMADDARRVAPQLDDGPVTVNDLINLPPRHCYAKVMAAGRRQPVFSLETWPVADGDGDLAEQLAARTTARYGVRLDEIRQTWAAQQAALVQSAKRRSRTRVAEQQPPR